MFSEMIIKEKYLVPNEGQNIWADTGIDDMNHKVKFSISYEAN